MKLYAEFKLKRKVFLNICDAMDMLGNAIDLSIKTFCFSSKMKYYKIWVDGFKFLKNTNYCLKSTHKIELSFRFWLQQTRDLVTAQNSFKNALVMNFFWVWRNESLGLMNSDLLNSQLLLTKSFSFWKHYVGLVKLAKRFRNNTTIKNVFQYWRSGIALLKNATKINRLKTIGHSFMYWKLKVIDQTLITPNEIGIYRSMPNHQASVFYQTQQLSRVFRYWNERTNYTKLFDCMILKKTFLFWSLKVDELYINVNISIARLFFAKWIKRMKIKVKDRCLDFVADKFSSYHLLKQGFCFWNTRKNVVKLLHVRRMKRSFDFWKTRQKRKVESKLRLLHVFHTQVERKFYSMWNKRLVFKSNEVLSLIHDKKLKKWFGTWKKKLLGRKLELKLRTLHRNVKLFQRNRLERWFNCIIFLTRLENPG
jgi:hypothetical protein